MAYITEKITVEQDRTVDIVCDWCGKSIKGNDEKDYELEITYTNHYGYDGIRADLCRGCAQRVKNIIVALGINVVEKDEVYD